MAITLSQVAKMIEQISRQHVSCVKCGRKEDPWIARIYEGLCQKCMIDELTKDMSKEKKKQLKKLQNDLRTKSEKH